MVPVSAVDAISPAIQRTKIFLFKPFRLGTYLKLCVVALLTEGFGGNSHFSTPGGHSSHRGVHHYSPNGLYSLWPYSHIAFTPERIAQFVAMSLLVILFVGFLFYLITRLRFAYFHCLIHNTKEIRPGWHFYREPATRFFWLNLIVGLCFLLLVALVAMPFVAGFLGLFRDMSAGGHPSFGSIFALVLPLIPIILLLILMGIAVDLVLRDLMLPHYALENATAGAAWAAVWARIRIEKASFFAYALLRILLPIIAAIVLFIILIIPAIVFIAVVAVVGVAIHEVFTHATGAAAMMGIFLEVVMGLVAFAITFLVAISVGGPVSTAVREYALLFYGSRYQLLGDILYPPPPIAPTAPAVP